MPVIAVVNRKGGSGKSTLATHLAAYCATHGMPAMLGDVDRQQSAQTWLRLRQSQALPPAHTIHGWAVDTRNVLRPPAGTSHVILDTPGGLRGVDLMRVVALADAIVMPVCNSVFDRESAAACHAELMQLPRVASGRCAVAVVGMRLDARTRASETVARWAADHGMTFIGSLREAQNYVRLIEQGLTLFDVPPAKVETDVAQWAPIIDWLQPVLHKGRQGAPLPAAADGEPRGVTVRPIDVATPSPRAAAPVPTPAAPVDAAAIATAARRALPLPANLGSLARPKSLKGHLEHWFGLFARPRAPLRNP